MSFDRQLDQVCQHLVIEEALFLEDDRQTVRPLRPVSSGGSMRVSINGVSPVPSQGVTTSALAQGSKTTPYNVVAGVSDKLVLNVDGGTTQVLTAPSGNLKARELARALNKSIQDAVFEVARNRIKLRTRSEGRKSSLIVQSTGSTLADVIGIPTDRMWRGKVPFPGWSLINDPNTLADRPTRQIIFDEVLKGFADFVEIDYATVREECRRCGGLGVENDWAIDRDGEIVEARDEALLIQEVLKITFTVQGSNAFHRWYGTNLINTIGSKLTVGGVVQNLIVSDIRDAFNRWQQVKKQQEEDVGQEVSDREFPFNLLQVILEQSEQDPTVIFVNSTVQNRSGDPIQIERGIRLPEPLDVLGSTAQQGVFRQSLRQFTLTG